MREAAAAIRLSFECLRRPLGRLSVFGEIGRLERGNRLRLATARPSSSPINMAGALRTSAVKRPRRGFYTQSDAICGELQDVHVMLAAATAPLARASIRFIAGLG